MDLILGPFADAVLPGLPASEAARYESLLDHDDAVIEDMLHGRSATGEYTSIIERIRSWHQMSN